MTSGKESQFIRQSEGDHKVRNREQQVLLLREPLVGLIILAFGAMPVFARVVAVALLFALVAVIEVAAKCLGAALFDVLHGAQMRGQHPEAELRPVLFAMETKDVGHLDHHQRGDQRSLMSWLMAIDPRCSALTVRCV